MINKVYQFTSKEFQGQGIRGGRKREGELINFLSLKGGLIERGGGGLIEDLRWVRVVSQIPWGLPDTIQTL